MARLDDVLDYESKYTKNEVLINKLEIYNQEELDKAERIITTYKLSNLYLDPCKYLGLNELSFDADHYFKIHKYLFEDIYDFAGEVRGENIYKTFTFCPPTNIYRQLVETLNNAQIEATHIENEEDLVEFIAKYYADLDVIHPFREGNGRALREFLREYVLKINDIIDFGPYEINYDNLPERAIFIDAVVRADVLCELEPLKDIFKDCLVKQKGKNL